MKFYTSSIIALKQNAKTILWVFLFGVAFGLVESAVVIYLRDLFYPDGFSFPLKAMPSNILMTELWRELATIIMLIGVGYLAGKNNIQRFAYFLLGFAVWDLFYYVFLKIFINWPESFMTWDILFLLPVAWIGPVLAPVILSILMLGLAFMLIIKDMPLNWKEWSLFIGGAAISIVSFTLDQLTYMHGNVGNKILIADGSSLSLTYVPKNYDWRIFLLAMACIIGAMIAYYVRTSKYKKRLEMMQMF